MPPDKVIVDFTRNNLLRIIGSLLKYPVFPDLQTRSKLFLAVVQTGVSGVKLSPRPPRYKKRLGKLGEVFWE